MRLSKRIRALADSVTRGHTAADIGTDHGYVPMLLIKEGISPRVIMSDISEGSLAKAKDTFRQCGLADRVSEDDFRTGDGLETIGTGEVDEIIIGGLGGHTIVDILSADTEKSRSFKRLVLQPRKHSGVLRCWLFANGWEICSDTLAEEGKFACEIITAAPSGNTSEELPYPEEDIRWKYPPSIAEADPVLASNRIRWKTGSIREQISNMEKSGSSSETIAALNKELEYLLSLLSLTESRQKNLEN